mgnify:CR=1 FL=1
MFGRTGLSLLCRQTQVELSPSPASISHTCSNGKIYSQWWQRSRHSGQKVNVYYASNFTWPFSNSLVTMTIAVGDCCQIISTKSFNVLFIGPVRQSWMLSIRNCEFSPSVPHSGATNPGLLCTAGADGNRPCTRRWWSLSQSCLLVVTSRDASQLKEVKVWCHEIMQFIYERWVNRRFHLDTIPCTGIYPCSLVMPLPSSLVWGHFVPPATTNKFLWVAKSAWCCLVMFCHLPVIRLHVGKCSRFGASLEVLEVESLI